MASEHLSAKPASSRGTGCVVVLLVLLNLQFLALTVPAVALLVSWNKVADIAEKQKLKLEDELAARLEQERTRIQRDVTKAVQQELDKAHDDLAKVVRDERVKMEAAFQRILEKELDRALKGSRVR